MKPEAHPLIDPILAEISDAISWYAKCGWSKADVGVLEASAKAYRAELKNVASAAKKGPSKLRSVIKGKVLKSLDGAVLAAVRSFHRAEVRLKKHEAKRAAKTTGYGKKPIEHATLAKVTKAAHKVIGCKPPNEDVLVSWVPKDGAKYRIIVSMGPMRTAVHYLIRDALRAGGIEGTHDYNRKGAGGEPEFVRNVCLGMSNGLTSWWTPDIRDYFPSLRPEHFAWLPLSKRLIEEAIYLQRCKTIRIGRIDDEARLASFLMSSYPDLIPCGSHTTTEMIRSITGQIVQRGLPQGSVLSPLLGRSFIGRELRKAVDGKELDVSSISDNLCIGSADEKALVEAATAVTEHLRSHPAGAIDLHSCPVRNRRKIRLLGLRLQYEGEHKADPVHVAPGGKRLDRFSERLERKLLKARAEGQSDRELSDLAIEYAWQWYNSQGAWTKKGDASWAHAYTYASLYAEDFLDGLPVGATVKRELGIRL